MYRKLLCLIGCALFLAVGCEKEPVIKTQPSVSPYLEMMLKGDVKEISYTTETFRIDNEYKYECTIGFDNKTHNINYYESNGVVRDNYEDLAFERFRVSNSSFGFYEFPDLWKETYNTITIYSGNTRTEYKWDQNDSVGIFTDIRCFIDDEPVAYEGEYNIAELLYYENGYPKHSFILEETGVTLVNKYEYYDFDHMGNPLKLIKQTPKEKIVITREITYW